MTTENLSAAEIEQDKQLRRDPSEFLKEINEKLEMLFKEKSLHYGNPLSGAAGAAEAAKKSQSEHWQEINEKLLVLLGKEPPPPASQSPVVIS
ncbi:hypothetical protein CRE_24189 [Caenorhabditis remanei]|uniref:Uncharacterized protein n=1 Tax=Caenorhabditis remanei TaxID=31234 RepID=E3N990_CAERE|nr:hypothetical protein CRE_24189 [Caenorhabditis remanei]